MEMDYTLAAMKLFCFQLHHADTSDDVTTLYGIRFQRAWLQGVVVSVSPLEDGAQCKMILDDGTGVAELMVPVRDLRLNIRAWDVGTYVMAVGMFVPREDEDDDAPMIQVHKIVDLSPYPDREAMWHMEVIEANNLFYDQSTPKRVSKLLSRSFLEVSIMPNIVLHVIFQKCKKELHALLVRQKIEMGDACVGNVHSGMILSLQTIHLDGSASIQHDRGLRQQ